MDDKKFIEELNKKLKEDNEEKKKNLYNLGGWKKYERKNEFVKEGKEIDEKRGINKYKKDVGNKIGKRELMN
jgi:methyl coenzyme M reductase alpha subunit